MASKSTGSASKYLRVPLLLPSVGDDSDDDNKDGDDDDGDDGNGDDDNNDNKQEEEEEEGDNVNNMVRDEVKYVAGRKKEAEEEVVIEVEVEVEVGAPIQSEEPDITMMKSPNSHLKGEIK